MNDSADRKNKNGNNPGDTVFEPVWKGYDAAQGQMLEELLRQEGFSPRLIGTRTAALIGMGQFTATLRIEVPSDTAQEARRVLDEFEHAPADLNEDTDDEDLPEDASTD